MKGARKMRGVLVLTLCLAACSTTASHQGGAGGGNGGGATAGGRGGRGGQMSGASGGGTSGASGSNGVPGSGGISSGLGGSPSGSGGGPSGLGGSPSGSGGSPSGLGGSPSGSGGSLGCGGAGSSDRDHVACTLQPLTSNYSGTWDLNRLLLRGTITVNGADMPDSPGRDARANVEFRDVVSGRVFAVAVQVAGPGAFTARIYPGTYDVTLITSSGVGLVGMPAGAKLRLATALKIDGGTPLDFDVRTVAVDGLVTANGASLPDSAGTAYRAEIDFQDILSGGLTTTQIKATGPGAFSTLLFASTYDVSLKTVVDPDLLGLPVGATTVLARGLALRQSGPLDYDVRPIGVNGAITVDGAEMPASPSAPYRGDVRFRDQQSGQEYRAPIGNQGPAAFSFLVFAGSYDVTFKTLQAPGVVGLPSGGTALLARGRAVLDGSALALDMRLVTASGTITVDGAAMPDSPKVTSRGQVEFRSEDTGDSIYAELGATGPGTFSTLLYAGAHDVLLDTTSASALVGLPPGASVGLQRGLDLGGNKGLTYDVHPITVDGTLTLKGGALPDSPNVTQRGSIEFTDRTSGRNFGAFVLKTGPGSFGPRGLFAGNYDISFVSVDSEQLVGIPRAKSNLLASNVALTSSKTLAYDLQTTEVSGTLTSNGAPLPDTTNGTDRGTVTFRNRVTGDSYSFPIGPTGPGTFSGTVYKGPYDVSFAPPDSTQGGATLEVGCLPVSVCP